MSFQTVLAYSILTCLAMYCQLIIDDKVYMTCEHVHGSIEANYHSIPYGECCHDMAIYGGIVPSCPIKAQRNADAAIVWFVAFWKQGCGGLLKKIFFPSGQPQKMLWKT